MAYAANITRHSMSFKMAIMYLLWETDSSSGRIPMSRSEMYGDYIYSVGYWTCPKCQNNGDIASRAYYKGLL